MIFSLGADGSKRSKRSVDKNQKLKILHNIKTSKLKLIGITLYNILIMYGFSPLRRLILLNKPREELFSKTFNSSKGGWEVSNCVTFT